MGQSISRFYKDKDLFVHKKRMDMFMLGLNNAGKTTILYKLKLGEIVTTTPTTGFNMEAFDYKDINFTAWDYGDQNKIRLLENHYKRYLPCLLFVVDSSDKERIDLAKEELQKMLEISGFETAPLLVLANKQDLGAMSVDEVTERLGLQTLRDRNWFVQGASCFTEDGLYEALDWMTQQYRE